MSGPQSSRKLPFAIHTRAGHARPLLRDDIKKRLLDKEKIQVQQPLYG